MLGNSTCQLVLAKDQEAVSFSRIYSFYSIPVVNTLSETVWNSHSVHLFSWRHLGPYEKNPNHLLDCFSHQTGWKMHWDGWMNDACGMFSFLPGVTAHIILHAWLIYCHWEQNGELDLVIGLCLLLRSLLVVTCVWFTPCLWCVLVTSRGKFNFQKYNFGYLWGKKRKKE